MITKEELKEYSKIRNLNLGQAEKDYFQNVILFILYQKYGKNLVFKGGTALSKCYGSRRFSEDLDFTFENDFSADILKRGLERFKVDYEIETKEYSDGLKIILRIKGPLYIGTRVSLCNFILDLSFREKVLLEPKIITIGRFLEEIPEFDVYVMQEEEILSEKIRTIMARKKARDVYDLWFLVKKNVKFNKKLAKKKMGHYNQEWKPEKFKEKIKSTKDIWKSELKPLIDNVPDFNRVKSSIIEGII